MSIRKESKMNRTSRMKRLTRALSLLIVIALVAGPASILAQDIGTGNAVANVVAQVTVTNDQNLEFGVVVPGATKTIAKTLVAAGGEAAGIIHMSGNSASEVTISVILPTYLEEPGTNDQMAISFSTTAADLDAAAYNSDAAAIPTTVGNTDYNPHANLTVNLGAGGDLFVFLGGTVYPRLNQTVHAAYTGPITIAVWYTGN